MPTNIQGQYHSIAGQHPLVILLLGGWLYELLLETTEREGVIRVVWDGPALGGNKDVH